MEKKQREQILLEPEQKRRLQEESGRAGAPKTVIGAGILPNRRKHVAKDIGKPANNNLRLLIPET
jgi:hypothetical protein